MKVKVRYLEEKELICGKCHKKVLMEQIPYGKRLEEFSWWCPNCKDKISQGAVMQPYAKEGSDASL